MPGSECPAANDNQFHGSIEELGFGVAQLRALLLSSAVVFGCGSHAVAMSVSMRSIASEFHLSQTQESWISVVELLGMIPGALLGGRLADRVGRRRPILVAIGSLTLLTLLASVQQSWLSLMLLNALIGFSAGLGLPPMVTLLSEISPKSWQIPVRALSESLFSLGFVYAALVALDLGGDPVEVPWRSLLRWSALPLLGPCLLATMLLPESPTFLEETGDAAAAREVRASMWRCNATTSPWVSSEGSQGLRALAASPAPRAPEKSSAGRADSGSQVALSGPQRSALASLAYLLFIMNVYFYGGMYGRPQALPWFVGDLDERLHAACGGALDLVCLAAVAVMANSMPRRKALAWAMAGASISAWSYGIALSTPTRSWVWSLIHQIGVLGFCWAPDLAQLVALQYIMEVMPTTYRATAAGLAVASARLGAAVAPELFANVSAMLGHWCFFFYIVALLCAVGAGVSVMLPEAGGSVEDDRGEVKPLLPPALQRGSGESEAV